MSAIVKTFMNNKTIVYLVIFLSLSFLSTIADAHVIKQGTVSIGASAFNETRNFEKETDSDEYGVDVFCSYFMRDNFEVGTSLSYDRFSSDPRKSRIWILSPIILYHIPMDENANFIVGTGVFARRESIDFSTGSSITDKSVGFTIRGGWEYYFNDNVALSVEVIYSRVNWDLSGRDISSDKETRVFWPRIGFRLFF